MKTFDSRASVLLVAMGSFACGSPSTSGDAGHDATVADVYVDAGEAGTCVLAPPGAPDAGYYLPNGYVLTPFLADEAAHSFAQADPVLQACKHYEAVIETDVGRMVIDFDDAQTPATTNSFVFLARNHYFDGIAFHRVVEGFVVQGGDPETLGASRRTWGTGGPGYTFGIEIDPTLRFDGPGVLGMARSMDPGSNGSQFFVTLAAQPSLDGLYTVFGRVTEGTDVPGMMAVGEPPATPTRMQRVYIVERVR